MNHKVLEASMEGAFDECSCYSLADSTTSQLAVQMEKAAACPFGVRPDFPTFKTHGESDVIQDNVDQLS